MKYRGILCYSWCGSAFRHCHLLMRLEVHGLLHLKRCKWRGSNQWPHLPVSAETPVWVIQDLALLSPPVWVPCCRHYLAPLSQLSTDLHQQERNAQGSQLCHAWKGEMKQGSLIRPADRRPWVAKGVRGLNCGSPVNPEQQPWLPLFWRILIFIIFAVLFPPFFFCLHCFFTLVRVRETKPRAGFGTAWTVGVAAMLPQELPDRRRRSVLRSLLPRQAWEPYPASELKLRFSQATCGGCSVDIRSVLLEAKKWQLFISHS